MENKLRAYMDHLFQDVPNTKKAVEVKEEILQNIVDKYHDLVAEGKSEEAAYNIAIASIGDLDELLASLKDSSQMPNQMDSENYMAWRKKSAIRISVAIMLYILCVTPPIITDSLHLPDAIGACGLFVFIAIVINGSMEATQKGITKPDFFFDIGTAPGIEIFGLTVHLEIEFAKTVGINGATIET